MIQKSRCRPIGVFLGACLVVACSEEASGEAASLSQAARLAYKVDDGLARRSSHVTSARYQLQSHPREKLSAQPVYFTRAPQYVTIRLGHGKDRVFTAVLDESFGTGTGYDTLYIDANNNEDLTDDKELTGVTRGDGNEVVFPTTKLTVPYGSECRPYHVTPHLSDGLYLVAVGYVTGELRRGADTVRVALFDNTTNGLYNDHYEIQEAQRRGGDVRATGDTMIVEYGSASEPSVCDAPALHYVGTPIPVGARCYAVTVATHGREITIREPAGEWGALTTQTKHCSALLKAEKGIIEIRGPGTVRVPAGLYQFGACTFRREDAKGRAWEILEHGQFAEMTVAVEPGRRADLRFGPPLTAEVFLTRRLTDEFRLDLKIKGQGGETYRGKYIQPVGTTGSPPAPTFAVVSRDGTTVATGQFKYG